MVYLAGSAVASLVLAAPQACAPAGAGSVREARELLPLLEPAHAQPCAFAARQRARRDLEFATITQDPSPEELRSLLSRGVQRTVYYEWDSGTGELSIGGQTTFTTATPESASRAGFLTSGGCGESS